MSNKTYRINEIFYSLQGEGRNAGRAAVFVRFSGCNLRCPFCDTDFADYQELTAAGILEAIAQYEARFVVLTGGEPTLQIDAPFLSQLHAAGYEVAMESNGTLMPPEGIDWLTISPKQHTGVGGPSAPVVRRCEELKCLFTDAAAVTDYGIEADHYLLQPCDVGNEQRNREILSHCIEYIKRHPKWQLSLQTHKLLGIR